MLAVKIIIATLNILFTFLLFFFNRQQTDKNGRAISNFVEFLFLANAILLFA